MESGAWPPVIKPSKQDEDCDCDLIPILSPRQFTFQLYLPSNLYIPSNLFVYDSNEMQICHQIVQKWLPCLNCLKINHPIWLVVKQ